MAEQLKPSITAEFEGIELGDRRLDERVVRIAESVAAKPDVSFPKAMSAAELEANYRFLGNCKVSPGDIIEPHIQQTLKRMALEPVVLVAHDTTTASFKAEDDQEVTDEDRQPFLVHVSLALRADDSQMPLGVVALSQHLRARTQDKRLQNRWGEHVLAVHARGVTPQSVIHLMDREGDDYDVLDGCCRIGTRFVIRVQHDRALPSGSLRDLLEQEQMVAEREVALSRRSSRGKGSKERKVHPPRETRRARLHLAACAVTLPRPRSAPPTAAPSLTIHVVRVWEPEPPPEQAPVEWILYTSEPIETPEQVLQVVDFYRARWRIEEYFKALKTGCALEKRQLGDLPALQNVVALLAPIAWRLLLLKSQARDNPTAPADTILDDEEIEVLRAAAAHRRPLPHRPTVSDAMLSIAALGGHLKHNGPPGWQTLAAGYQKLRALLAGWALRRTFEKEFRSGCDQ